MPNSNRYETNDKPRLRSWDSKADDASSRKNIDLRHAEPTWNFQRQKKRVTFNFDDLDPAYRKKDDSESEGKSRNLKVSKSLGRQFKAKSSRFIPETIFGMSETKSSFRSPKTETPIPLPYGNPKIRVFSTVQASSKSRLTEVDYHEPRRQLDATEKIKQMRSRILAGHNVSTEEIKALKEQLSPLKEAEIPTVDLGPNEMLPILRNPRSKKLYCVNGIVKVPTPHSPASEYNTFGSPADLRISLSNSDTPEYSGRRRFFFDFTGFSDKEIKLILQNNRRLIIKASRPHRANKCALHLTETVDLPKDLPVDNLRIVRDPFGTLIVEEAWKFT